MGTIRAPLVGERERIAHVVLGDDVDGPAHRPPAAPAPPPLYTSTWSIWSRGIFSKSTSLEAPRSIPSTNTLTRLPSSPCTIIRIGAPTPPWLSSSTPAVRPMGTTQRARSLWSSTATASGRSRRRCATPLLTTRTASMASSLGASTTRRLGVAFDSASGMLCET